MPKIAIVGSAPSSCDLAPWQDEEWDIWSLAWREVPRANALFELHEPSVWHNHGGPGYRDRLAKSKLPIWLNEAQSDIESSLRYPVEVVKADISPAGSECDFFTSSIAYMLALAIVKKPEAIGLYGVDMLTDGEYAYQRPAIEYLIGLARGRGISVRVSEKSSLCRANFVYGTSSSDGPIPQATGITVALLTERIERYRKDRDASQLRVNMLEGAIAEAESLIELVNHYNRGGVLA